ncbi:MAG: hypothetical protein HY720_18680, partial [Planctomycetes bacterium]|nr:hypothetical protein [Planctomycetota bacterium]
MTTTTAPPPAAPLTSRVMIEHEKYIPISKHRIKEALFAKLREAGREDDLSPFTDFLRLIEAIYHFEYHTLVEEVKRDYEVFEAGRNSEVLASMTPEEIKVAEDRFLANFLTVMEKGNFLPLTQADVDLAEGESYLFNLPVVIDWDKLDSELLARYFSEHPYGKEGDVPPEFANRILIFKRGVGVDRTEGRFVGQKFEMLLGKFFGWLLHLALAPFRKGKKKDAPEGAGTEDAGGRKGEKTHMHETRWIERVTLKKSGIDFKSLFQKTTLQEATFERLVIAFRPATPAKKKKDAAGPPK